jgi:hypothetical protein
LDLSTGKEKSRRKVAKQFLSAPVEIMRKALKSGLKSEHPKVRRMAFALIGEIQDSYFFPDVLNGLTDPFADVVQMAVWAIGRMKVREAIPALIDLLKKRFGFKVTKTVIWAFGEIGDRSVVPLLKEKLQGASSRLCEGILVCGIKLGEDVFVDLLKALDFRLPSVQSALRDFSYHSRKLRKILVHRIVKNPRTKEIPALLNAFPYMTLQLADYHRLLAFRMRMCAPQSINPLPTLPYPKGSSNPVFCKVLTIQATVW